MKNLYGEKRTKRNQNELNAILAAHEKYVAARGGARAQLAHSDLDGLLLNNRKLAEADFSGASLVGASLYGANLERASFYCADLRDCDLRSARLARADLRGASFKGAKLSFATLDNADLRAAMMMYVAEEGVKVVGSEREPTGDNAGVDFSNCSLKGASFGNAKLDNANFAGALLSGANFRNAKLTNASFKDAVLTGVLLKDLGVPPEALDGAVTDMPLLPEDKFNAMKAKLDGHQKWIATGGREGGPANFDNEDMRPLHKFLVGRPLSGLSARGAICIGLDFSGSQLQAAKFDGADLRDTEFFNADLRGASLRGAKLAHARFERANLGHLPLSKGASLAPDMSDAVGSADQFAGATLEDKVEDLGLSKPGEA